MFCIGRTIRICTGRAPGIPVNLVATTLYAMSPALLPVVGPVPLAVFIVSLSVTHSFLDTIPSVYLGAPESENALAVLPGQKMLLQGEGHQAILITILGTFSGLVISVIMAPLFIIVAKTVSPIVKPYLAHVLIGLSLFMIIRDKGRLWAALVFLLSGGLGVLVLSMDIKEPLFPMLSGLFGMSGLVLSLFENTKIPLQKGGNKIRISTRSLISALVGSSIGVFFIQFFPGMGPAQGAALSVQVVKGGDDRGYLALVGAMGTMSVVFSLVTFFTLGKAKDGSIVVISRLLEIDQRTFSLLLFSYLAAGALAVPLVILCSRIFCRLMSKVNYAHLVSGIIISIVGMCLLLSGPLGLLILLTSTAIGLVAPLSGTARSHAMGCLILPVIMYLVL